MVFWLPFANDEIDFSIFSCFMAVLEYSYSDPSFPENTLENSFSSG